MSEKKTKKKRANLSVSRPSGVFVLKRWGRKANDRESSQIKKKESKNNPAKCRNFKSHDLETVTTGMEKPVRRNTIITLSTFVWQCDRSQHTWQRWLRLNKTRQAAETPLAAHLHLMAQ